MKYVTELVNTYSKKQKLVDYIIKQIEVYIDDESYINKLNEELQPVESVIEQVYYLFNLNGIDIDYTWVDIEDPAEHIVMKFNAINSGIDQDLTDILDI
jgi:hypothetical protein